MEKDSGLFDKFLGKMMGRDEERLEELWEDSQRAHQRAEGCGCATCRKRAERLSEEYIWEEMRLYGFHQDQEEEWLMWMALKQLDQLNEEDE